MDLPLQSLDDLAATQLADIELDHGPAVRRAAPASRYALDTTLAIGTGLAVYGPVELYVGGLQQFVLNRTGMSALSVAGISRANQVFREAWMHRFGIGEDVTLLRRWWHETASGVTFFMPLYEAVQYLSGESPANVRDKLLLGTAVSLVITPAYNWARDTYFVRNGQPGVLQRRELGPPSPGAEVLLLPVGEAVRRIVRGRS